MWWKTALLIGVLAGVFFGLANRWAADPVAAAPGPAADKLAISHLDEVEETILALTNDIRRRNGLGLLQRDVGLRDVARGHSDDMIQRHFFEHTNPDGHDSAWRISTAHRRLIGGTGENIWRYATTLEYDDGKQFATPITLSARQISEKAMDGWMNSPGHRANILRPQFTHLGVGMSLIKGETTITQNFAAARAYLKSGLPDRVKQGASVDMGSEPYPVSAPGAALYDFFKEKKGEIEGEPFPLSQTKIAVKKGRYQIRFYFPVPGGYEIYGGPRIEVR